MTPAKADMPSGETSVEQIINPQELRDHANRIESGDIPAIRAGALLREAAKAMQGFYDTREMRQRDRAAQMPTEQDAIEAMFQAWYRLKELGWNDVMYCPKDGTRFKVIQNGSTGIFDCYYQGKWPDGCFMVMDEPDCYPTSIGVAMYRLYPEDEAKLKQKMADAAAKFKAEMDAENATDR